MRHLAGNRGNCWRNSCDSQIELGQRCADKWGSDINQSDCYSCHKSFQCLIYQKVTTPDGISFHMYGQEAGRHHDLTFYRESRMDTILKQTLNIVGKQYYIYGDPAYILWPWIQIYFSREFETCQQILLNKKMQKVLVSVENSYRGLKNTGQNRITDEYRTFEVHQLYSCTKLKPYFRTSKVV